MKASPPRWICINENGKDRKIGKITLFELFCFVVVASTIRRDMAEEETPKADAASITVSP